MKKKDVSNKSWQHNLHLNNFNLFLFYSNLLFKMLNSSKLTCKASLIILRNRRLARIVYSLESRNIQCGRKVLLYPDQAGQPLSWSEHNSELSLCGNVSIKINRQD